MCEQLVLVPVLQGASQAREGEVVDASSKDSVSISYFATMIEFLLVMLGGAVGSGLRYGVGMLLPSSQGGFPWATLAVNVVGSFVLGMLIGSSLTSTPLSRHTTLLLGTGLCGGFTTYSAFAVESVLLAQEGHITIVAVYVVTTLACCTAAALVGVLVPRMVTH
jgi:CrcB protein